MKKAIKVIGIIALIVASIVCTILYCVFPNETQDYIRNFWSFINTPLPIVGVSLVVIGGFTLKALSMTSWGKKALKELEDKVNGLVAKAKDYEEEAKSCVEKAEKREEETKLILAEYKSELDTFAEQLAVACETSPNAKIREYAKTIRAKKEEIDTLYAEKKNELAKSVDERIAEQNRLEKCEQEIMGLRGILEELKGLGVQNESEE